MSFGTAQGKEALLVLLSEVPAACRHVPLRPIQDRRPPARPHRMPRWHIDAMAGSGPRSRHRRCPASKIR